MTAEEKWEKINKQITVGPIGLATAGDGEKAIAMAMSAGALGQVGDIAHIDNCPRKSIKELYKEQGKK